MPKYVLRIKTRYRCHRSRKVVSLQSKTPITPLLYHKPLKLLNTERTFSCRSSMCSSLIRNSRIIIFKYQTFKTTANWIIRWRNKSLQEIIGRRNFQASLARWKGLGKHSTMWLGRAKSRTQILNTRLT